MSGKNVSNVWTGIRRLFRRFRNTLAYRTVTGRRMNTVRPPRSLPADFLLQFSRFFGRRQFRRLATTTVRAHRVRERPRRRGRRGRCSRCGCDDHWFKGG